MAGVSLPVEATGRLRGPVSFGEGIDKLSLSLETTIDRTAFGMVWQMELPGGGQALANDVRLVVELELNKELIAMRILAISGSVRRDSHNARLLRHVAERAPAGVEIEIWDGLKSIPPYDEDDDVRSAPRAGRRAARGDRRGRRPAVRDPRVQLLDPGRAQERDRLGLAPARDDAAAGQAGRGDRRHHRQLRRRLGAGRAAQGARLHRRPGRRPRAAGRARPTRPSTTTAP